MTILTTLTKSDFENILDNYNIGHFKRAKHCPVALQSTVYFITTTKGKFILKIFESTKPEIAEFQLKIMDLLTKKRFDIPKLIQTTKKENSIVYKNKHMFIQEFFKGKMLTTLKNKDAERLGEQIAKLHLILSKVKRERFLENRRFMSIGDKQNTYPLPDFDIQKKLKQNILEFNKLDKTKLKISILHGDLCGSNMLESSGQIMFIDWDDACIDYYVRELAIVLASSSFIKKTMIWTKVRLFLKGYEKLIPINSEERKAMYFLVKQRLLGAIEWCCEQAEIHTDRQETITTWMNSSIKKYKTFSKISLNEFITKLQE